MQEQQLKNTAKYRLQVKLQGKPAFDPELESLAFQMVVLMRRIHDANGEPCAFMSRLSLSHAF